MPTYQAEKDTFTKSYVNLILGNIVEPPKKAKPYRLTTKKQRREQAISKEEFSSFLQKKIESISRANSRREKDNK